jgi:hypothetical protein
MSSVSLSIVDYLSAIGFEPQRALQEQFKNACRQLREKYRFDINDVNLSYVAHTAAITKRNVHVLDTWSAKLMTFEYLPSLPLSTQNTVLTLDLMTSASSSPTRTYYYALRNKMIEY